MGSESEYREHRMSTAAIAIRRVRKMAAVETRGFGDDDNALRRLEAFSGIGFWTLRRLKAGKAKSIDGDLAVRIAEMFVAYFERKVAAFQHELLTEKALEADADIDLDVLASEVEELAAKIAKAKAARLKRNLPG